MRDIIEQHYREHREEYVKKLARRAGSPENAEDVVQDAFYKALRSSSSYDHRRPFIGWFLTILNNSLRTFKACERKLGMSVELDDTHEAWMETNPEWSGDLIAEVEREIEGQSEVNKDIFRLYFLLQYQPREIVEVLDVTSNSVRSSIKRFKKTLEEKHGKKSSC